MRNIEVKRLEPKELEEFQREVDDLLDLIRWRAGELFAQHGAIEGRDLENWLEAETQLLSPRKPEREPKPTAADPRPGSRTLAKSAQSA